MDILSVSSTVFQPFDGTHVGGLAGTAPATFIYTPAPSVRRMDYAGRGAPNYILTPVAQAKFIHLVSAHSTYIVTSSAGGTRVPHGAAGVTYILGAASSSTAIRLVTAHPTYILTPQAGSTMIRKLAATSNYIFTATCSEQHFLNSSCSVTYMLGPQALAVKIFAGQSTSAYRFTPAAGSHVPNPHREIDVSYRFSAAVWGIVETAICTDLGRYRRGDVVSFELDLPYIPDRSPYAVVLDEANEVVQVFAMSRTVSSPGQFLFDLFVDATYLPGHFTVVFEVQAGTVQQEQTDQCFTVIGGGDAGGPVISLACYQRGKIQSVLAHLGNGELVLGQNPSLDYTPPPVLPSGWQIASVG